MATKRQPVPRAWNNARREAVQAGMEIIHLAYPLTKNSRYRGDPDLMRIVAEIVYTAHHLVDQLTSIPQGNDHETL